MYRSFAVWTVAAAILVIFTGCVTFRRPTVIVVDVRPTHPPPAPQTEKLSPELLVTAVLGGRFIGLTRTGRAVIELPAGVDVEAARARLSGVPGIRSIVTEPDAPVDEIRDLIVIYRAHAFPVVGRHVASLEVVDSYERGRFVVLRAEAPIAANQLREIEGMPPVEFVQPSYRYRLAASPPPNDPKYLADELWGLARINAPAAWATVHDSPVRVAVIDSGIDYSHPDLACNMWVNVAEANGSPGVDDDNNGCVDDIYGCDFADGDGDPADVVGHGTQVAGIIAAVGDNGIGGVGVAWHLQLMAVRIIAPPNSDAPPQTIAKAIDYAVSNGARVLNASWTAAGASDVVVSDAISRAEAGGALLVAAAGNILWKSEPDIDKVPVYPAAFTHDNVIAVLALDQQDAPALFTNFGAVSVDLGAPGVDIASTTLGHQFMSLLSGTSFATPYVTGAAALVWAHDGSLTAHQVRQQLLDNTRKLGTLRGMCATEGALDLTFLQPSLP